VIKRARAFGRLDHDHAERDPGDQPVAAGKVLCARREAGRPLADEQSPFADGALQLLVLGRINYVDTAGEHGDGAVLERGNMRRGVDAAGEPGGDDEALKREIGRNLAGEFLSDGGAVARTDDGDDRNVGELQPAFDVEEGRRRIDLGERRRIARLADGDQACPQAFGTLKLGLGFGLGAKADVGASAATRQKRQRGDGGLGAAELVDQGTEGGGSHVLAADQPEPGDTLRVIQTRRGLGRS
jgi:hypothetical protein